MYCDTSWRSQPAETFVSTRRSGVGIFLFFQRRRGSDVSPFLILQGRWIEMKWEVEQWVGEKREKVGKPMV